MIDLNRINLGVKIGVNTEDGKTRTKVNEQSIVLSNNTLRTLFSHLELCLNGKLISHSNNCYLDGAFTETEPTVDANEKNLGKVSEIRLLAKNKRAWSSLQ